MSDSFNTTETNWQGVDAKPAPGSKNLVESGGVAEQNMYISELHQGYIDSNNTWQDLATGYRYYAIIPIDSFAGESLVYKGNGNSYIIGVLSDYNPIEEGDANVINKWNPTDEREYTKTIASNAKYLYVTIISGSGNNITPVKLIAGGIDLLGFAKDNIGRLNFKIKNNSADINNLNNNLSTLAGRVTTAEGHITTNTTDISNLNKQLNEQKQNFTLQVPVGATPSTQDTGHVNVSSYGIRAGSKIYLHTEKNNGIFTGYYFYINGTSEGMQGLGDKVFTLSSDLSTIRFRITSNYLVLDENNKTVGGDAVLNIVFNKGFITITDEHFEEVENEIQEIIDGNQSTVISRNKEIEDAVHAAAYNKIPTTNSTYTKAFSMLVSGDIHADATRMENIIKYLNAMPSIDCGILLGDIVASTFNQDATFYTQKIAAATKPWLTVIGNHDAGSTDDPATSYTTQAALIAKFITPNIQYADLESGEYPSGANCYYYKDFSTYKIRLIVLNQYDYPDEDAVGKTTLDYRRGFPFYSQTQLNWLITTLGSVPNDYHVIICLHCAADNIHPIGDSLFTSEFYKDKGTVGIYEGTGIPYYIERNTQTNSSPITDIVDAWINKSAINLTYNIGISSVVTSLTAVADFTSRTESNFVCYLGGHWHNSIMSECKVHTEQKCYNVDCAVLAQAFSDTPRKVATRSEDCFVVMTVDTNRKRVNLLRIGAHWTEALIDRLAINFSY